MTQLAIRDPGMLTSVLSLQRKFLAYFEIIDPSFLGLDVACGGGA